MDPEDLLSGNEHPAIPYHQEILVRDDFWQKATGRMDGSGDLNNSFV